MQQGASTAFLLWVVCKEEWAKLLLGAGTEGY